LISAPSGRARRPGASEIAIRLISLKSGAVARRTQICHVLGLHVRRPQGLAEGVGQGVVEVAGRLGHGDRRAVGPGEFAAREGQGRHAGPAEGEGVGDAGRGQEVAGQVHEGQGRQLLGPLVGLAAFRLPLRVAARKTRPRILVVQRDVRPPEDGIAHAAPQRVAVEVGAHGDDGPAGLGQVGEGLLLRVLEAHEVIAHGLDRFGTETVLDAEGADRLAALTIGRQGLAGRLAGEFGGVGRRGWRRFGRRFDRGIRRRVGLQGRDRRLLIGGQLLLEGQGLLVGGLRFQTQPDEVRSHVRIHKTILQLWGFWRDRLAGSFS